MNRQPLALTLHPHHPTAGGAIGAQDAAEPRGQLLPGGPAAHADLPPPGRGSALRQARALQAHLHAFPQPDERAQPARSAAQRLRIQPASAAGDGRGARRACHLPPHRLLLRRVGAAPRVHQLRPHERPYSGWQCCSAAGCPVVSYLPCTKCSNSAIREMWEPRWVGCVGSISTTAAQALLVVLEHSDGGLSMPSFLCPAPQLLCQDVLHCAALTAINYIAAAGQTPK